MFKNRNEAAFLLAERLSKYKNDADAIVLAIPRGGVPIGSVLANELHLKLDIVLSKKIGHPFHKEFAIGAVTSQDIILSPEAADVPKEYIEKETEHVRSILNQRYKAYYGNRKPLSLTGKTVIIVDDGVATGNTLISCVKLIQKQQPNRVVVALPVSPPSTLKYIKEQLFVDEVICLMTPMDFYAVGQFYENFGQVSDREVVELLTEANLNYTQ